MKRHHLLASACIAFQLVSGCGGDAARACASDADCAAGQRCAGAPQGRCSAAAPGDGGANPADGDGGRLDGGGGDGGTSEDGGFLADGGAPAVLENESELARTNDETTTARALAFGALVGGSIGRFNETDGYDRDTFKLTVAAGELLRVTLTAPAGSTLAPFVRVHDEGGGYRRDAAALASARGRATRELFVARAVLTTSRSPMLVTPWSLRRTWAVPSSPTSCGSSASR